MESRTSIVGDTAERDEQRMRHLQLANQVRSQRAAVRAAGPLAAPAKRETSARPSKPATLHDSQTVARVVAMAEAGWLPAQIQRALAKADIRVSQTTIKVWIDPEYAERRRRSQRIKRRDERSGAPLLNRMRRLYDAGLSFPSIAIVMSVEEGIPMTSHMARYWLKSGREPRPSNRRA